MNKTIILVGGVALLAYNHVSKIIKAFQASSIKVVGGKFVKQQNIDQSHIVLRFQVNNPTSTTYSIGSFTASLTYQGKLIATSVYNNNDVVRPGINFIDVTCQLQTISTAQSIVDVIKQLIGGNFNQQITLAGTFTKWGYSYKVNETFRLKDFF